METLSIREEITRLEQELADLEAERTYTLRQTGVHILTMEVEDIRQDYEKQMNAERKKISKLNKTLKIREEITQLEQELEDLEAQRKFTLGQTGVHIPGAEAEVIREHFSSQINAIKNRISELNQEL